MTPVDPKEALVPTKVDLTTGEIRVQTASDPATFVLLVVGLMAGVGIGSPIAVAAVISATLGAIAISPAVAPLRRRASNRVWRHAQLNEVTRRRLEESLMIRELPPQLRERYMELKMHIRDLHRHERADLGAQMLNDVLIQLDQIVAAYLRMLGTLNNLDQLVANVDELELYRQLEEVDREAQKGSERVRQAKRMRRGILEKRRERLETAREHREVVVTQLAIVEDIVKLLQETTLMFNDPATLQSQLDELMDNVATAEEAVQAVDGGSWTEAERLAEFDARVAG